MIEFKRYDSKDKIDWDDFLEKSRIDTFLFKRDFMDYHSNRFNDHSFLIYRNGKLESLLPGNMASNKWYSHQGLTYGGLINSNKILTKDVLEIFDQLNNCLKSEGIEEVIYKPTPHIYHTYPSEEDLYALFRIGAEKIACNISSTIFQKNKIPFIESRKSGIRKAMRERVSVVESTDWKSFWKLLEENLDSKHGKKPVHSFVEIQQLKTAFPEKIKLYCCFFENNVIGGALLFVMENIVHVQYIAASELGKNLGALDLLFHELINNRFSEYPIFDFGHSTEQNGNYLNDGLIFQKEGFGCRGIIYETYKYNIR